VLGVCAQHGVVNFHGDDPAVVAHPDRDGVADDLGEDPRAASRSGPVGLRAGGRGAGGVGRGQRLPRECASSVSFRPSSPGASTPLSGTLGAARQFVSPAGDVMEEGGRSMIVRSPPTFWPGPRVSLAATAAPAQASAG
jgi:hypothetical protein